ncbi:chemotaxis protein CheD [Pirellulales bacterium]|nr:chemotaxis protein CheD [Pirellulales bacterium]
MNTSCKETVHSKPKHSFQGAIGMGQIAIASRSGTLRTLVGSCVSVALCDPNLHVAGMAHVLLPESHGATDEPGKFADTAITELLHQLRKLPGNKTPRWVAKIAGGAAMFPGHDEMTVGRQNITAVETALRQNDIPVVMKSCGGELGRRVTIDVATGSMDVEFTGNSEHHNPTQRQKQLR